MKKPGGSFDSATTLRMFRDDGRHVGGTVGVGQHDHAALAVLPEDLVRAVGFDDVCDLAHRYPSGGRLDQQIAQPLRGSALVLEPQDHVEAPVAVHDTRNDAAVGEPFELLGHGRGLKSVERGAPVIDDDFELRDAHLLFDLQVDHARNGRELLAELLRQGADGVEILAEDLEGNLRAHARQHVVQPVRDGLAHVGRHRQDGEARADVVDDLVLRAAFGVKIDIDLGGVHALGMLVEFGTARAASDRLYLRDLHDQPLGDEPDPMALRQRDPGIEQHRDRQRALVEGRQEGARKLRRKARRRDHAGECTRHQRSWGAGTPIRARRHCHASGRGQQTPHAHRGASCPGSM